LKSTFTEISANGIEECRKACGGHGYSKSSGLPDLYSFFVHYCTAEGDNTIMAHQLVKYLRKSYKQSLNGKNDFKLFFTYFNEIKQILNQKSKVNKESDFLNSEIQIEALKYRISYLVNSTFKNDTKSFENEIINSNKLSNAQSIYAVALSFSTSIAFSYPSNIHSILKSLCDLFCLHQIDQNIGDYLMNQYFNEDQVILLRSNIKTLLGKIRVDALPLVDSFGWTDRDLLSCLGSKDGNAYENLMKWFESNPLNKHEVTPSYQNFIRPMIKKNYSKL
jgi:acyl-CoA oxidase